MKKIITICLTLFTLISKASDSPKIKIEYRYTQASDTTFISRLRSDKDFCCKFEIVSIKSDDSESSSVIDIKTGFVLGRIYGRPSKTFLDQLSMTVLSDESIKDLLKSVK